VTAARKRPTGPPPSAGVLARYAQAYARELGVAELLAAQAPEAMPLS